MTITGGLRALAEHLGGIGGDRINGTVCRITRTDTAWTRPHHYRNALLYGPRAVERVFILSSLEAWGRTFCKMRRSWSGTNPSPPGCGGKTGGGSFRTSATPGVCAAFPLSPHPIHFLCRRTGTRDTRYKLN